MAAPASGAISSAARPRFARRGADRGQPAGQEAERRRHQRERSREIDVRAARRVIADCELRIADWVVHAIASATAAATAVLMKLSMSLFRIPGPLERRAKRALDQRACRRGDDDGEDGGGTASGRARRRPPRARTRRRSPAAVPSSDIAPDVPGLTRPERRDEKRRSSPGLADLARDRVAAAGGERRDEREDERRIRYGRWSQRRWPPRPRRRSWRSRCPRRGGRRAPPRCRAAPCAPGRGAT